MQFKIKNQQDFWSGLMYTGFGIITIVIARDYPMGSAVRMGPGYFPVYLGGILAILGVIITLISLKTDGKKIKPLAWRPTVLLSCAFGIFAWAIDTIGFVLALLVLIFVSAFANKEFKFTEITILSIVLIVGCWALFIMGLKLPFHLWWK
ncbi:MAG: tripartite tricarboxylate transporter TctB family protein [Chloroflexota bacterium]